jgi:hypothetical protein
MEHLFQPFFHGTARPTRKGLGSASISPPKLRVPMVVLSRECDAGGDPVHVYHADRNRLPFPLFRGDERHPYP